MPVQNSKRKIVVATTNPGKIVEIREVLRDTSCEIFPINEVEPAFQVEEDGQTYAENAIKKAKAAAFLTGTLAIADDSGLEVDALVGAPGIYSARFGGEHLPQSEKNKLLLQQLQGVTNRSARFRCIIAVVSPQGKVETTEGVCEGIIGTEERGTAGFGFDPLFIVPEYGKTLAELGPAIKNRISHRAKALSNLREILPGFLALGYSEGLQLL
jgi:XTP/dITP diphosphohydrolase